MEKIKFSDVSNLYLGCEIMQPDGSTARLVNVGILGSESQRMSTLVGGMSVRKEWGKGSKPLLRKLDSMTEEERKELWQVVFDRDFPATGQTMWYKEKSLTADPRWVMMSGVERLGIEISGDVWADSDLSKWKFNPNVITKELLRMNFDLFSLIENDEALDAVQVSDTTGA